VLKDINTSRGSRGRIVLVASALPGDGKTFTAANLALSLSLEPDHTVLLIDADVVKPQMSALFGVRDVPGLLDATLDPSIDVESLVRKTDVPGLSILAAGRPNANATEAFSSQRMTMMFDQLLAVPSRLIVLDTLPLLLTTESRALVPHAGQILLVVRADVTPRSAIEQCVDLVDEGVELKLVLNAVDRRRVGGYGQYYGYKYDYRET
jgi:Mrp family chromosome partitioning ATPase